VAAALRGCRSARTVLNARYAAACRYRSMSGHPSTAPPMLSGRLITYVEGGAGGVSFARMVPSFTPG
jgi:hypothetical protein